MSRIDAALLMLSAAYHRTNRVALTKGEVEDGYRDVKIVEDVAVLAGLGRLECDTTSPLQVQPGVVQNR